MSWKGYSSRSGSPYPSKFSYQMGRPVIWSRPSSGTYPPPVRSHWRDSDPETRDGATIGDPSVLDLGGCISVLTSSRPTPISKGNGVHSNLCKIEKA